MKKARFLLIVPAVAAALYLRQRILFPPNVVFRGWAPINHLVFSPDGKTLLIVGQDHPNRDPNQLTALDTTRNFATRWTYQDNPEQGQAEMGQAAMGQAELGEPKFFDSGKRVLVDRGSMRAFDTSTGEELWRQGTLRRAAISADGGWLAYTGAFPSNMGCLVPATISRTDVVLQPSSQPFGQETRSGARTLFNEAGGVITNFTFSPDGKSLAVNVMRPGGNELDFYDVKTWKRTRVWSGLSPERGFVTARWSPDGRFLLTTTIVPSWDKANATLWRVSDGKKLSALTASCRKEGLGLTMKMFVPSFSVQNDGRVLKWGTDGTVSRSRTSNLGSGFQQLLALRNITITSAALAPDGSYLVAGTRNGVVIRKPLK